MPKTLLAWSSGKDSAWTLHVLRTRGVAVSALLEAQAEAAGVPVWQIPLPWPCTNDDYESRMAGACRRAVAEGFDTIAFGDLFLRDVRAYREKQLAGSGLQPVFPLWEIPTASLAREMIGGGLRARLSCIDSQALEPRFAGREFDSALLADLPPSADPCGENGEFHTFAYAGPMFRAPIPVETGEIRTVERFVYADLLCPGSSR